jgi:hypothetical protein
VIRSRRMRSAERRSSGDARSTVKMPLR